MILHVPRVALLIGEMPAYLRQFSDALKQMRDEMAKISPLLRSNWDEKTNLQSRSAFHVPLSRSQNSLGEATGETGAPPLSPISIKKEYR